MSKHTRTSIMGQKEVVEAIGHSFLRLTPAYQMRNPVMFCVYVGAIVTTALCFHKVPGDDKTWFVAAVSVWLWFTCVFANFAEAIAEGRGKAQAASLRAAKRDIQAKRLKAANNKEDYMFVSSAQLKKGDIVLVEKGQFVPGDGQVIEGVASVDESAITGESAPVIRESGGDRDAVTGGTRVLSDWLVVRITSNPGESFLDKMIALVEGAKRQKTPNEIALAILLAGMTIIFLLACVTLLPYSMYAVEKTGTGTVVGITVLIALLVCLAPTTIGGLLSAIGIAGMNRLVQANVIAKSGRAVESAGDVNVLLLDKTGTITHGNRQAVAFHAAEGISIQQIADAAEMASLADETPEGKSIVQLAHSKYSVTPRDMTTLKATFIPFSAETRASGITLKDTQILKGAVDAIEAHVKALGGDICASARNEADKIARDGGTPLMVCKANRILGVVHLKDIVKHGIKERLADLRRIGIKSVMITGDNPLTAAAIATEAGVDDYIAQATPQTKLAYIKKMQVGGELVAMVGDGTNDAARPCAVRRCRCDEHRYAGGQGSRQHDRP